MLPKIFVTIFVPIKQIELNSAYIEQIDDIIYLQQHTFTETSFSRSLSALLIHSNSELGANHIDKWNYFLRPTASFMKLVGDSTVL